MLETQPGWLNVHHSPSSVRPRQMEPSAVRYGSPTPVNWKRRYGANAEPWDVMEYCEWRRGV